MSLVTRYKYVWDSVNGTEYVFDLQEDPHEMINLAEKCTARAAGGDLQTCVSI